MRLTMFFALITLTSPLLAQRQEDWHQNCWTINVQQVDENVILVYRNNDAAGKPNVINGNTFDEQEMTRCLYSYLYGKDKPEVNDFVGYGQTVPDNNQYPAYFMRAMNASPGLGVDIYDRSSMFGSKGRLLGIFNTGFSVINPAAELQNIHFDMLHHEIGHAKCCYIGHQHYDYKNEFGDGFGHWSNYLGRNARGELGPDNCSTMRASPYAEIGNGEAQTRNCHYQNRPVMDDWEMYLWGFKNADDMRTKQFPSVSPNGLKVSHDIYQGRVEKWLTVTNLIAKLDGEMVWPPAEFAPKHLQVLFALVIMPGTDSGQLQGMIERWKQFARTARASWNEATHRVSTLNDPSKLKPTMLVNKDYLAKWDFSYHPGELMQLQITGAPPNQPVTLVAWREKKQYQLVFRTDKDGKASFSAIVGPWDNGQWSAVAYFGENVSSNVITFEVAPI